MNSLPEEFFEELNELLKVQALDELEREAKCGMDELVESLKEERCCTICESSDNGCGAKNEL